jgi:uncharacterized protein (TIGR02147 family)
MQTRNYSQDRLLQELARRQRQNPQYSMRALAKHLGLAPTVISEVIRGKRRIPKKVAPVVAQRLGLGPLEASLFLKSIAANRVTLRGISSYQTNESEEMVLSEERHYKILAEWEHYAIMSLVQIPSKKMSIEWIAMRLGITKIRAQECVDRLLDAGLLVKNSSDSFVRTQKILTSTADVSSSALRESHLETLKLAQSKLETTPLEKRDYSSSTMAIDSRKIPEAKQIIREFRRKLSAFLKEGSPDEVYQLSVQLFLMTGATTGE